MKNLFARLGDTLKGVVEYFRRRPQSRSYLVRLILYMTSGVLVDGLTRLELHETLLYVFAIAGIDLFGVKGNESQTTPINDPKVGKGRPMPPELRVAALAVQTFLPGPIGELWDKYGEGLWGLVETARLAMERAPTQSETDTRATEGL